MSGAEGIELQMVLKWPMTAPVEAFDMPVGSRVIDVRCQNNLPTLWTLGPAPGGLTERRTFIGHGTGHYVSEENLVYVGSSHDDEAGLVFHIFERPVR